MSELWRTVQAAMADANRADELLGDPEARHELRRDPELMLLTFELRALHAAEDQGARVLRTERRAIAAREARRAALA
jgi:hypothetical protein